MSKTEPQASDLDRLMRGEVRKTGSYRSIRTTITVGVILSLALVGGVGSLAATTVLSGAVSTIGRLEVESKIKKVQHPTGGVVAEIMARDGDRVVADQVLVRLDETIARANLSIVSKSLDQMRARLARLTHERDNRDELVFPADMIARRANPDVAEILADELRLFEARRAARDGQRKQLTERIRQSQGNIEGLGAQIEAKDQEIALITSELEGVRDLYAKKLVPSSRLTQLERDGTRLKGERGALVSSVASEKGRMAEVELQILSVDEGMRSEVGKEIRDVQAQVAEVAERSVAAMDTLKRLEIRAPQGGIINQSAINTVGGVVGQGETLMYIVPEHDTLVAEVNLSPADIDQIYPGQPAHIRLTAFDRTTTPELNATLTYVSADLSKDERTGATYYSAKLQIPESEVARLGDLRLVPGMPVEAFIRTTDRTILSYLMKPITDQMSRAFRES